ncbi:TetR/AcrR family transcriptional regulator [Nonomuraea pusilla]|nr:TetR/AcrR family transcriptional regulator [Nonomuraea pusilla]
MARAGLNAERLTAAAAELADEIGFANVTVSELARRFGVKDASLYSHIRNLQDLRTRVALYALRDLADRLTDATAGKAGKDALAAFGGAYRAFMVRHPGRYAASQTPLDPEAVAGSEAVQRVFRTTYALVTAYGLREPDATDAVRLLRSTFQGFAGIEAAGQFGHPRPAGESWNKIIDALDCALRHWQVSP